MKIRILSDLHLEFGPIQITELPDDKDTVLILAGDIHTGMRAYDFVMEMCERFYQVIYVLGNHEFYGHTPPHIIKNWEHIAEQHINLYVLENGFVEIDGVVFAGGTLWTDCNNDDWFTKQKIKKAMTDFRIIKNFGIDMAVQAHIRTKWYLDELLKRADPLKKKVIITHHLPIEQCITEQWKNNPINPAFACTDMGEVVSKNNIDLWIYGHTHQPNDFIHANTRFLCNPRGYHGFEFTDKYNDAKVVEI